MPISDRDRSGLCRLTWPVMPWGGAGHALGWDWQRVLPVGVSPSGWELLALGVVVALVFDRGGLCPRLGRAQPEGGVGYAPKGRSCGCLGELLVQRILLFGPQLAKKY